MSASPLLESACPSCGEELPPTAHFCPACGAPADGGAAVETPVARERVEPRWLGLPAAFVLLCLAFAGLGAAIGLFATGNWAWGVVAVFASIAFFAALAEATRGGAHAHWTEGPSRLAVDRRAQAATAAQVWRTRFEASVSRWRTRSELDRLEDRRRVLLQTLGAAVTEGDTEAQERARERLSELDAERDRLEEELAARLAATDERIRQARLPVQETMMVTPNEPNDPYPPPGEADPPQPAQIPEPYPAPDEGTPPSPVPDDE